MTKLVGLIHPHAIDHLAPVLGHDVEQVVDHLRLWALCLDLQLIGRGHIDRDRLDALANALGKLLEEGPGGLAGASCPNPEHLPADRIDHHCGVAMAFMQGKFIHRQIADVRPVRLGHARSQTHLVDRFDRVPAQIVERGHRLYAGRLQQLLAGFGESLRHPLVATQPVQLLQAWPATTLAPDAPARDVQHHPVLEERQITYPPNRRLMNLRATRSALLAVHDLAHRLQIER
ncbi:hypothetical protein LMG10661_00095 [Ralstonia syzygii subsp. syzygii]|nr:hypothetical protein LMG10661_00095 [Ralstonia syzygii subsp. syzygii]